MISFRISVSDANLDPRQPLREGCEAGAQARQEPSQTARGDGKIIADEPLEARHRDHPLVGNYAGRRECHLEPDWLLIYKLDGDDIIFERTGTHADLFR